MLRRLAMAILLSIALISNASAGDDALVIYKSLSPDVALEAAQAALKRCRDSGYQIAVAVVDRFGQPQVMLRDRYAGPHTPDTAIRKAFTAVSFRTASGDLARLIRSGQLEPGLAQLPHTAMIAGGIMIEAGGSLIGAIGVSGAPGGERDDECARAGIDAIRDKLDF